MASAREGGMEPEREGPTALLMAAAATAEHAAEVMTTNVAARPNEERVTTSASDAAGAARQPPDGPCGRASCSAIAIWVVPVEMQWGSSLQPVLAAAKNWMQMRPVPKPEADSSCRK